jgi:hypothetical protein
LPGGLKAGVQLQVGVAVEVLLGLVLNLVVLYASGEFAVCFFVILFIIYLLGSVLTGYSRVLSMSQGLLRLLLNLVLYAAGEFAVC